MIRATIFILTVAFLFGCTEADVSNLSLAQISNNPKSVQSAVTDDRTQNIRPDLPFKYYKSVEGHDNTCGFKDRKERIVVHAIYDHCAEFHDGMAYATHGYVDKQDKVAIPVIYPIFFDFVAEMRNFSEDRVAVYEDDKWGFIDKQGKPIIPPFYSYIGDFSNELATVLKEREYGAVNHTSDTVIDFRY